MRAFAALAAALVLARPSLAEEQARRVEPVYALSWTEGLSIPSAGSALLASNFGTTMGGKVPINDQHAVFGIYDLSYQGPGLKYEEGREFQERTLDHNGFLEHQWGFIERHTLKSRVMVMREMRRTAANETFGAGLYDFWVLGAGVNEEFAWLDDLTVGGGITYRSFTFPNYTDLLREFQAGGASAEKSGGQQDYSNLRVEGSAKFNALGSPGRGWIAYNLQSFSKAKVIDTTGAYGSAPQRDNTVDLGGGWALAQRLPAGWPGKLQLTPELRLTFKRSNQNFVRFKSFGDPSPVFVKDNYSYSAVDLSVPVRWQFESGYAAILSPRYYRLGYASRPPRNADGDYVGGTQANSTVLLTLGAAIPMSRFSSWTVGYTFQSQSSNNKFEKFLPYNFTGHTVFSAFDITF